VSDHFRYETASHGDISHQEMLMTTKSLVRFILERATAYDWSWQGLGMFRLYLSRSTRLHVWDPSSAVKNVSTLHTHPWHFTSTVISGAITDRLFEMKAGYGGSLATYDGSLATHMRQRIVCGPGGHETNDRPEPCRISLLQEVVVPEGCSYSLGASAIHESRPEPGTVTIIEREFLEDTEHAFVFYPIGEQWVSAVPRPATHEEIERMAKLALSRMKIGEPT